MHPLTRPVSLGKFLARLSLLASALTAAGCATHPPTSEKGILSDVTQLTWGFDRAGEAYFSPRMDWIVFQATPPGESNYQMYVAPLRWNTKGGRGGHVYLTPVPMTQPVFPKRTTLAGIGTPTRVSPNPSKNTCGFFSPDQVSLVFASTANKEPATRPVAAAGGGGGLATTQSSAGYQRSTNSYRWEFPAEMGIFR